MIRVTTLSKDFWQGFTDQIQTLLTTEYTGIQSKNYHFLLKKLIELLEKPFKPHSQVSDEFLKKLSDVFVLFLKGYLSEISSK